MKPAPQQAIRKIEIFNMEGEKVRIVNGNQPGKKIRKMNNLPSGIYFSRIYGEGISYKKIIVH